MSCSSQYLSLRLFGHYLISPEGPLPVANTLEGPGDHYSHLYGHRQTIWDPVHPEIVGEHSFPCNPVQPSNNLFVTLGFFDTWIFRSFLTTIARRSRSTTTLTSTELSALEKKVINSFAIYSWLSSTVFIIKEPHQRHNWRCHYDTSIANASLASWSRV